MGETKYIFVTGGVASSLGKGIISSSIGKLLQARGYKVTIQKFDPYINIDPGTLNPYEHGECYVTVDGHEADLDLGHYERFLCLCDFILLLLPVRTHLLHSNLRIKVSKNCCFGNACSKCFLHLFFLLQCI